MTNHETRIEKDASNKKLTITRDFDAVPELVWRAWTESELLDQWWAPKPYRAETRFMDFRDGGHWLYAMVSPANERQWCRADFGAIEKHKSFRSIGGFCDENGVKNDTVPDMHWYNTFHAAGDGTRVIVELSFDTEEELSTIISMGFREGFTAALGNLDQYLEAQFKLRSELKKSTAPRVTTYLNFPGTTEEAFTFYKSVFRTEFSGSGIRRFGDIPAESGHPPVAESVKNMVLHVELPILGGHVLMATDSPKEMGFSLSQGTNMHICLEPESREETRRLFNALSEGGNVTMSLTDMFFGAYFGTCTDRFGINWMFNCMEPVPN